MYLSLFSLSLLLSVGQITAEVSILELRLYLPVMSARLCFRSAVPQRLMDSSEDKCYMNKNSSVDCTKAFVDEPEPVLLRGRENCRDGRGLSVTHV